MTVVKAIVSVGLYFGQGPLYAGLAWIFRTVGLCGHHRRQLAVSVIVVPLIGDALQFAVQDGFLKKQELPSKSSEPVPETEGTGAQLL
eukprot:CAMPEP_0172881882 /NCGR_PEP_ID=MMETSP1075-20121228/118651_1 /TAXON_ID=2916 /ORGANISM="Ceratium fusus, Strain PA161109" /LENGTH=87 /DNA_ID=CAMNT_0013734437 /DNA_START=495 /DNA_END=758 /DNA_ORIENTATION=-